MDYLNRLDRLIMKYVILAGILILVIFNYENIFKLVGNIWQVIAPVIYGFGFAYVLNLLMVRYEKLFFRRSKNRFINKIRRPFAIIMALLTVIAIVAVVLWLIIPQLVSLIQTLIDNTPMIVATGQKLFADLEGLFPDIESFFDSLNLNWESIARESANLANNLLGSTFTTVQIVSSTLFKGIIVVVVAIYALFSKEKIVRQFDRLGKAYLKKDNYRRFSYVVEVTDQTFSGFLTGMLFEAIIYGSMVTIGMWMFRFPYAGMIGALSGVMALIPMVGAIASAFIGFLLIFVQNPIQGILFIIFNIVVQQIESNVFYPRVVGNQIGLPGIWTFIAVTIGGGLMGPVGFFLGVPVATVIFKLLKGNVEYREEYLSTYPNAEFKQF